VFGEVTGRKKERLNDGGDWGREVERRAGWNDGSREVLVRIVSLREWKARQAIEQRQGNGGAPRQTAPGTNRYLLPCIGLRAKIPSHTMQLHPLGCR
jgi:hypothetical protein